MTNNATVLISENILKTTADAIRNKGGASGPIKPTNFAETIKAIATGGLDTSDATATAAEILSGETAYVNGRKLIGAMPNNGVIFSTMDGIEAKSVSIPSGYTDGGTISLTDDIDNEVGTQADLISDIMAALEGKGAGGGTVIDDLSRSIIEGTITEISDDEVKIIKKNAFAHCYNLTTASFPACTSIDHGAFSSCASLATVSFPVCTSISGEAFRGCRSLTAVSFPACTTLMNYVFYYCDSLTTALFPACTVIGSNAFGYCSSLTSVSFPVCTRIEMSAFANCSKLASVFFPDCSYVGSGAFQSCRNLTTASFPACYVIISSAFRLCRVLSSIQLGFSSVCTLWNSNAFLSTPFAGYSTYFSGTPYIYVPSSLITAYQSATNWTYFSSYFSAIESLEE